MVREWKDMMLDGVSMLRPVKRIATDCVYAERQSRTRSRGGGPPRRSASRISVALIARKCGGDSRASTQACLSCGSSQTHVTLRTD